MTSLPSFCQAWRRVHAVAGVVAFTLLLAVASVAPAAAQPPAAAGIPVGTASERSITIDFDSVDINLFIKYISELTGRNFVVDRAVQGNVTILSPTRISEEEAYRVFESVLEVYGYTTVPAGAVTKILPSARARSQNLQLFQDGGSDRPEDRVVTQLVPLLHASPEEMKRVLTPLVAQTSLLIAHSPSAMLLITDTRANIQKLLGIIAQLDVESREKEVAVLKLEKAKAADLARILTSISRQSTVPPQAEAAAGETIIVPYEQGNALILLASATELGRLRQLVAMLDTEAPRAAGNIHVYYLQNATAAELVKVLSLLPDTGQAEEEKGAQAAEISKNVRVMADEETNALIITASPEEYLVLEEVIGKLDIPRRMVYLEALIMEVDADKSFDVGVQWAAAGAFDGGSGQLVTGFSGSSGFDLLPGISGDDPTLPSGYSLGLLKQGIRIGGVTFPNIAAILRAYKTDSSINIISTPQILTTDNKKAEISVGENVPYITSRNTTSTEQDYSQYEYRDVATKLSIVPHINQADTLRLEIETEVVRIKGGGNSDTPTTYKRTATTTVVLNDRDTIVIGGIIGHDATESEWKVPLLGDIPLLGWLFKTRTTASTKTNMFIFVTPRIVRNPVELAAMSREKESLLPATTAELPPAADPEQTSRLVRQGYEKLRAGQSNAAREYFAEVLAVDPSNPYALINMGAILEKEGNPRQAAAMYQAVIAGGTAALAEKASAADRVGVPLLQVAREALERLAGAAEEEERDRDGQDAAGK